MQLMLNIDKTSYINWGQGSNVKWKCGIPCLRNSLEFQDGFRVSNRWFLAHAGNWPRVWMNLYGRVFVVRMRAYVWGLPWVLSRGPANQQSPELPLLVGVPPFSGLRVETAPAKDRLYQIRSRCLEPMGRIGLIWGIKACAEQITFTFKIPWLIPFFCCLWN